MKLALCQINITDDKPHNLQNAREKLYLAASGGAAMAILPEMFCINYKRELFHTAAESVPDGECCRMLSEVAKETHMVVVGGSIPEQCGDDLYNTSMVFDKTGAFLGKYRKAHMFDINLADYKFMESETIRQGNTLPLIFSEPIKTGVAICFDIRFPEWSRIMMERGVDLIALPAAFSVKTGPKHWELLLRARALDNQCFVAGVSPASSQNAYGHSMLCAPDGRVIVELGTKECIEVVDVPMDELAQMRESIPIATARRVDLYHEVEWN